jgi:hypothetical protein
MKTYAKIACLFIFILSFQTVNSQEFPKMDASPMDLVMARADRNSPPIARVIYSRPLKKERKIFGELVPYGEVWRTGANEATELTLYQPLKFGNTTLEAGTYTLYTIPDEDSWTIISNSDTNVWGAYSYKKEKDVARMKVDTRQAAAETEALSMAFRTETDGTTLMIGWDDTYVEIPFKKI